MNNYRFISSFYYPTDSRAKSMQAKGPAVGQPAQMPYAFSPVRGQHVGQAAQQAEMELIRAQQMKRAPPVVDHYFAPIPVIERPLIESSYCNSGAAYSMKHSVAANVPSPDAVDASPTNVEIQPCPPVPPPSADLHNYEAPVVPQMQYPLNHHQLTTNFPMMTYSTDPTLSPVKHTADQLRHEFAKEKKEKVIPEAPEYSDYAWKRIDREKCKQFALNQNYDFEQEFPPADVSAPFSMGQLNQALQQTVEPTPQMYKNEEVNVQVQPEYAVEAYSLKNPVDSEYIGIPNDLYPAYRQHLPTYAIPEKAVVKQFPKYNIQNVAIAPRENIPAPNIAVDEDAQSDVGQCDTAQENPMFRSRFTTQVKQKDLAAPVRLPEVPRYTTQYSTVGNAFAPVGQPQISEYQYEDLNDLASCIDAI